MQYKTCAHCGSNLDPGERCEECQQEKSAAARTIRVTAYNEVFREEYAKVYSAMTDNNLPSCIANDIAGTAARKRAINVASATAKSYCAIKRNTRRPTAL